MGSRRGQHGDLLHQLFRMELLDDADDGVQGDDQDEQEVGPRPHQSQSDGDQNVEQIEQGTYMSADDLAGRLGDGGAAGCCRLPAPATVWPQPQSGRERLDQVPYRFASHWLFQRKHIVIP